MRDAYRYIPTLRISIYQYAKILIEILLIFFLEIRDTIENFTSKHYHKGKTEIFAEYRIVISNLKSCWIIQIGKSFDRLEYTLKYIMNPVLFWLAKPHLKQVEIFST